MRLPYAPLIGLLLPFLLLACSRPSASPVLPQDVYVWQRIWTPALHQAALNAPVDGTLRILAEQWNPDGQRIVPEPDWQLLRSAGRPMIPVIRVQGALSAHARAEDLYVRAAEVMERWNSRGLGAAILEIDHDSATGGLPAYAAWLAGLRQHLPVGTQLQVTALPSWMQSSALWQLAAVVDGFILQVHAVERPEQGLFRAEVALEWVRRFSELQAKPFRVSLPAYGSRVSLSSRGRVVSVRSESPTFDGAGNNAVELRVDPREVARFKERLSAQRHARLVGLVWFRLPLADDRRAWSPRTWEAVVRNSRLETRIRAEHGPADASGLREFWLSNSGTLDGVLPHLVRAPAGCLHGEGVGPYALKHDGGLSWLLREESTDAFALLKAGQRMRIGWARCPPHIGESLVSP